MRKGTDKVVSRIEDSHDLSETDLLNLGEKDIHSRYYTQNQYFSRLQNHFIKKGKKATMEKVFRDSFLMPANRKESF